MQFAKLKREEFLTWVAGEVVPIGRQWDSDSAPGKGEVAVVGQMNLNDRTHRPLLVVRNEEELQEFFAFVSTYVSTYVPFSAFFRVLSLSEFQEPKKGIPSSIERLKRALVGVVLCDALLDSSRDLSKVHVARCLVSESYAMAKVIIDGKPAHPSRVSQRWRLANRMIRGERRERDDDERLPLWEAIFCAVDAYEGKENFLTTRTLSPHVRDFLRKGSTEALWEAVRLLAPEIGDIQSDMSGPREKRARAFTSAIRSEELMRRGLIGDFVVGYLGVLLAGGAFEYATLMTGLKAIYPTSSLWFGFISGAIETSDVLTAGSTLGRHVLRELDDQSELVASPDYDISYAELWVLGRAAKSVPDIRSKSSDLIKVELFPGTSCYFAVAGAAESSTPKPDDLSKETLIEARRLVARLQRLLHDDLPPAPRDDLFSAPIRRRGRT